MRTHYCRVFSRALILLSAALVMAPSLVSADCGPAPNNGFGANYPSYAAWCSRCGGRSYNDRGVGCDMSGAAPARSYNAPAAGGIKGAVLQGIQKGIQQGQQNAAEQRQKQQMENSRAAQQMSQDNAAIQEDALEKARLIEEKNRSSATKVKQTEAQRTNEIVSQMRGGFSADPQTQQGQEIPGGSLQLKDLSAVPVSETEKCARETDFNTYQKQESEKKKVLGKLSRYPQDNQIMKERADWCKMRIPLPPSPSSADYCRQKQVYADRMNDWRVRCAAVIEAPTPSPRTSVTSGKKLKQKLVTDCLGVYDGEAHNCISKDTLLFSNCINKSLQSFVHCMNFDDPDKGTSVP